ncbi:MAG: DUF2855 family protein [Burkholderiaceae bacterium]|nr:DUF2855 family protein [Burkholderiaceae bacterium]
MSTLQFLVRKDQLTQTELRTLPDAALTEGQVRVRVDRFALTSNNITYAAFGEAMNYWGFYPTGQDGWGIIPVWGFGTVVQSLHPGVAVGEKLYGYYPMASSVVLQPTKVNAHSCVDGAAHRTVLHPVYNQYMRTSTDPYYTAGTEDIQALLRPLFITSWLIEDFLEDNRFFGANTAILSSASSKTAYGTAFQLQQRASTGEKIEVIGLTSPGNVAFCESLGCYHRVLSYDALDKIAPDTACVYVDFAGHAQLRRDIHGRFANLAYSCSIGGTHVDNLGSGKDLAGPRPVLFFAPAQIKKRIADWGGAEFGQRMVQAWTNFTHTVTLAEPPWLTTAHHQGAEAVSHIYAQVLGGKGDPRVGHMLSLN